MTDSLQVPGVGDDVLTPQTENKTGSVIKLKSGYNMELLPDA